MATAAPLTAPPSDPAHASAAAVSLSTACCQLSQRSRCHYGATCKFAHLAPTEPGPPSPAGSSMSSSSDQPVPPPASPPATAAGPWASAAAAAATAVPHVSHAQHQQPHHHHHNYPQNQTQNHHHHSQQQPHQPQQLQQQLPQPQQQQQNTPYPVRAGAPDCQYYLKTGKCNYGARCRFNHPHRDERLVSALNRRDCFDFVQTGTCPYGKTCKYNHPAHTQTQPGSATLGGSSPSKQMSPIATNPGRSQQQPWVSTGSTVAPAQVPLQVAPGDATMGPIMVSRPSPAAAGSPRPEAAAAAAAAAAATAAARIWGASDGELASSPWNAKQGPHSPVGTATPAPAAAPQVAPAVLGGQNGYFVYVPSNGSTSPDNSAAANATTAAIGVGMGPVSMASVKSESPRDATRFDWAANSGGGLRGADGAIGAPALPGSTPTSLDAKDPWAPFSAGYEGSLFSGGNTWAPPSVVGGGGPNGSSSSLFDLLSESHRV